MKKLFAALIALVVALHLTPTLTFAQTDVVIESNEAYHSFGQHITFHLEASSTNAEITEITLFFEVEGRIGKTPVPVTFQPAMHVAIDVVQSPAEHDLQPFTTLSYWWEIGDAAGNHYASPTGLLYYADNRYDWLGPARDQYLQTTLEVFWIEGDLLFAQTALNTALVALDEQNQALNAPLPGVIRIFIYPGEADLRSALRLGGYDWAGGQARPELGAILVGIPNDQFARDEMERLIPHELTHLLVYQRAGRRLGNVPPWLDEGLAAANELRPAADRQALLEEALANDRLLALKSLCAPFPQDQNSARLAYAQSASVVQYIRERYGNQAIRDLLSAYADGASCDLGVERALGLTIDGLDSTWRARLTGQPQVAVALNDSVVWLALWLMVAALALPLLGTVRKRIKINRRDAENDE